MVMHSSTSGSQDSLAGHAERMAHGDGALALVGAAEGLADAEIDDLVAAIYAARALGTVRRVDLQP